MEFEFPHSSGYFHCSEQEEHWARCYPFIQYLYIPSPVEISHSRQHPQQDSWNSATFNREYQTGLGLNIPEWKMMAWEHRCEGACISGQAVLNNIITINIRMMFTLLETIGYILAKQEDHRFWEKNFKLILQMVQKNNSTETSKTNTPCVE
jgi:hypothetical protein